MTTSKWLMVVGLALTLAGALILAWRDMRRGSDDESYERLLHGFPRTEARLGFPLIAAGSALQIVAVVID
jgi:hypothetical protein